MDDYNNLYSEYDLDHSAVVVRKNGQLYFIKPMADDSNTQEQEEHVLDLFCRSYAHQRYGIDDLVYRVLANDLVPGHRHDFTVEFDEPEETLEIEVTRIGESGEVFMSHELRKTALAIAKQHAANGKNFFAFLPSNTRVQNLESLFNAALQEDPVEVPPRDQEEELSSFVEPLMQSGVTYVKVCTNDHFQIHTSANQSAYLREIVQEAIKKKEAKNYGQYKQENMILLIDDRLLDYDRNDIDQAQPFLANELAASTFKEIHIISRKTSYDTSGQGRAEFMTTPIKAAWSKPLFEARVLNIHKLLKNPWMPFSY